MRIIWDFITNIFHLLYIDFTLFQSSSPMSRLDKADILELTVGHLTTLEHQQRSVTMATEASGYKKGYKDCARETITYLSSTRSLNTDTLFELNNHLQSSYLQKTRQAPSALYLAEVTTAHVSSQPDSSSASDITLYQAQNSSYCTPISEYGSGVSFTPGGYHGYDQFQACYNPCNVSVDTSFNSSCNMSLDSSAVATPEKLLPVQDITMSLDSSSVVTPEKLLPGQDTDMSLDSSSVVTPEKLLPGQDTDMSLDSSSVVTPEKLLPGQDTDMSLDSSSVVTPEKLLPGQDTDMSLDSSSVVTPEKLLPGQDTDMSLDSSSLETPEKEDVWRPW